MHLMQRTYKKSLIEPLILLQIMVARRLRYVALGISSYYSISKDHNMPQICYRQDQNRLRERRYQL